MLTFKRLPLGFTIFVALSTVFAYQENRAQTHRAQRPPSRNVLWAEPGDPSTFDFQYGAGGIKRQPQPPFRFVSEDLSGTSPKVNVKDGRGVSWNVKWGDEAHASIFCTRLISACGYYAEPEYFLPHGRIEGAHGLTRAGSRISRNGSFENARFQLRTDSPKFMDGRNWEWDKNPFLGTRELQGLKILMLLVSNWDTKKSNLAIFEDESADEPRYLYVNVDW